MNQKEELLLDSLLKCDDEDKIWQQENHQSSLSFLYMHSCKYEPVSPWNNNTRFNDEKITRTKKQRKRSTNTKKSKCKSKRKSVGDNNDGHVQEDIITPLKFNKYQLKSLCEDPLSLPPLKLNENKPNGNDLNFTKPRMFLKKKLSRSTGVLSYDVPSWRFITDLNTYEYLHRCHPKDVLKYFKFLPRTKSSNTWRNEKSHILDPAAFIDERLAVSFKALKSYSKTKLDFYNITKEIENPYISPQHRLIPKTSLKFAPDKYDEEEEETVTKNSKLKKIYIKSNKKCQLNPKSNKVLNQPPKMIEQEDIQAVELPRLSLPKIYQKNRFMKGANKLYHKNILRQSDISKQLSEETTGQMLSSSYLPTLSFNNYQPEFCFQQRIDPKSVCHLPSIATTQQVMDLSPSVSKINLL